MDKKSSHRESFELSHFDKKQDEIEIIAITAGVGNGWQFSTEVLHASLA